MEKKVQNRLVMVAYLGVALAYATLFYVKYKAKTTT